jgi:hypothetical protein
MPEEPEGPPRPEPETEDDLRALARLLRDPSRPRPATPTARRFEVLERLAEGPQSRSFRARDREDQGQEVELEILVSEALDGLAPEVRAEEVRRFLTSYRGIHDTHVLRPRDGGVDPEGRVFLVWDLASGETLRELLARRGALPPRQAFEIARQAARGLEALHAQGLAHGGLAPNSVGLAARVPWTADNPFGVGVRLRRAGVEALRGEPASTGQDLLALGLVLAECLTGNRLESDGSNWPGSAAQAATARLSERARALLDLVLSPRADERPAGARALRSALEALPELGAAEEGLPRPAVRLGLMLGGLVLLALLPLAWRAVSAAGPGPIGGATPAPSDGRAHELATELEREREQRATERAAHDQELARLHESVGAQVAELARAESECRRLAGALDEAAKRGAVLDSDLAEATRRRDALAAELATTRSALEARERDVSARSAEADGLRRELANARTDLERTRSALELARAERPLPGPSAAGASAAEPGPGSASAPAPQSSPAAEELARLAASLADVQPEGRLDLAALGQATELETWARRLDSDPALAALPAAQEVLALDAARRFYLEREELATPPAALLAAPSDGGWREELLLRTRLCAPDSAYPGPDGARFLYYTRGSSGEESWRWELVRRETAPPAGAQASWLVEQRFFDASGRSLSVRSLRIARVERALLEIVLDESGRALAQRQLFDLARRGAGADVRTFAPEVPTPPVALGVAASRWVAFRAALARGERRALVLEGEGVTLWVSPELGLVRAEHGGRATHELAYAELGR